MNEVRDLRYRADELVWHALNTGDLSVTIELRKINDRLEVLHKKTPSMDAGIASRLVTRMDLIHEPESTGDREASPNVGGQASVRGHTNNSSGGPPT